MTTAEGSISSNSGTISSLQNAINNSSTGLAANATAISGLESRVTATEGDITSNSSDITALQNTVNHSTTGVSATASGLSALTTRVTTAESGITTNSTDITTLETTVNNPSTGVAANASAVSGLSTRVTTAENTITSQGSDITALATTVNDTNTGVSATASGLSSLTTIVTNQGGTLSSAVSDITTLQTTVGGNTTSISTNSSSINGLEAQYTVKIDNNGAVAGYGLASTTTASGNIVSEFIVNADRFAILKTATDTGTPVIPFTVITSTQTINGETVPPGVYITDGFIKNGTITNAKIGDAAIDNAKIASLSAAKITAGTINSDRLSIDGVTLDTNNSGELILRSGGVFVDNLSQDAVGVVKFAINNQTTSVSNQSAAPTSFTSSSPFSESTTTDKFGIPTTVTLPEVLHTTLLAEDIPESGEYFVDFRAAPIGQLQASSTTSGFFLVIELQRRLGTSSGSYSNDTTQSFSKTTEITEFNILPLVPKTGTVSYFLNSSYDYKFRVFAYMRDFSTNTDGLRGVSAKSLRLFRIHKT